MPAQLDPAAQALLDVMAATGSLQPSGPQPYAVALADALAAHAGSENG